MLLQGQRYGWILYDKDSDNDQTLFVPGSSNLEETGAAQTREEKKDNMLTGKMLKYFFLF